MVIGTKAPEVQLVWEPINAQQEGFVASKSPRSLFSGAFGAGKSVALLAKALRLLMDYPNNFGYICRKTRASIKFNTDPAKVRSESS